MISVEGVTHRYAGASELALDELQLTINRGELFGLLGPNGAGKTTLISLLTGLRKLRCGNIHYDKLDIRKDFAAIQKKIAWVPQEYAFYPSMTVQENLLFFANVQTKRSESGALTQRIDEAVSITGLEQVRDKRAVQFSGGLKRRLNVAISLLGKPECLFLDEPTVGIDPQSRHFILNAIRDINATGTTIVYSSHYMEEVESLCDRIAIIDHGKLLKSGSLQQLLASERVGAPGLLATLALRRPLPEQATMPAGATLSADRYRISADLPGQAAFVELLQHLTEQNIEVNSFDTGAGNLEQLFLRLTHRSLRD